MSAHLLLSINMKNRVKTTNVLVIDPANFMGGAELYMLDFLQHQKQKMPAHFTLVTTGNAEYVKQLPRDVKHYPLQIPRLRFWSPLSWWHVKKMVRDLKRIIEKEHIQLIWTNSVRANIIGSLLSIRTKIPVAWMLHDFTFPPMFVSLLAKVPHVMICVSYAVKSYYLSVIRGENKKKLVVIPNAIDIDMVYKRRDEPSSFPLKNKEYWIGVVGRVEYWKGQEYLIRAAEKILPLLPRVRFFIIGAPVEHDAKTARYFMTLKKYVSRRKLTSKIYFTGYLPNVYPLLYKLDVLVHTSIKPEPFGRVILDGMALGKPVIASPLGGPKEIIEDGVDGLLIDPKDTTRLASSIIDLCYNDRKRKEIGENARRKVEKYYLPSLIYKKLLTAIVPVQETL